ncbi:hypothetical protein GQ54DRAFT_188261 [Martensiomyces pterosporus]|nr:hypothetical protein GQ54DRAFT_188261 [Martensiomyces pterosporus]
MLSKSLLASACILAAGAAALPQAAISSPSSTGPTATASAPAATTTTAVTSTNSLSADTLSQFFKPSLIVFGDSMSDDGYMPHYSNYSHYWGGRYSNSYMWNEYAAMLLNMNLENYAAGGSTTNNTFSPAYGRTQLIPSVSDVVQQYIANNTNTSFFKKRTSIIAMDGGANDIFYAISDLMSGAVNTTQWAQQLVANQMNNVNALLNAGYRNIYLLNLPDMSKSPASSQYGGPSVFAPIMSAVNQGLQQAVNNLVRSNPFTAYGVQIYDLATMMDQSLQPTVLQAINVTDTTNSCLSTNPDGSTNYCTSPDTDYYYDEFHPTGRPHYLIGVQFANTVWSQRFDASTSTLVRLANSFDIAHSDSSHNIIASSSA